MSKHARINLTVLKAVSLFVSKEETRYYLNGVKIEVYADRVVYVATDSHRMFAYNDVLPVDAERNTMLGELIIPFGFCTPFKMTARALASDPIARLEGDATVAPHTLSWQNQDVTFRPIDGTFPDYRRILPPRKIDDLDAAPQAVCLNWDYVASFQKAGSLLLGEKTRYFAIIPNGAGGPAWISWGPDKPFYGVIMPVRCKMGQDAIPLVDWLDTAPAVAPDLETVDA